MSLYKLFGILLYRRFVSSTHLLIYSATYLYQYGHMEIYFILWVVVWFCVISFAVQSVPAQPIGALWAGSAVPLVCSRRFVFWAPYYSLTLQKAPSSLSSFPVPTLELADSARIFGSFSWRTTLENLICVLVCCLCVWESSLARLNFCLLLGYALLLTMLFTFYWLWVYSFLEYRQCHSCIQL